MVVANFFQSIGKAKVSVFLSLSRQLVFLIPMLLVLPTLYGVDGVWYSMPVADTISALVTAIIIYLFMRKINKQKTI